MSDLKLVRTIGVCESSKEQELRSLLNSREIIIMSIMEPDVSKMGRCVSYSADAIVLYTEELTPDEERFMSEFFNTRKGVAGIMIVDGEKTLDIVERAMRCGISKVVSSQDADAVAYAVIDEAARVTGRENTADIKEYDSKVISVYSSKGGSGKTTVAINIAVGLHNKGKKVCLVDMDIGFGNLSSIINTEKGDTIIDLLGEPLLTPETIKGYLRKTDLGIEILCAPDEPTMPSAQMDPDSMATIMETLRANHDYVVVDCDHQIDSNSMLAMQESNIVVLVTCPEIPTLRTTNIVYNRVLSEHFDKVVLVVNKSGMNTISDQECSEASGLPVFASLPFDPKTTTNAINSGIPVANTTGMLIKPKIIGAMDNLVNKIIEEN